MRKGRRGGHWCWQSLGPSLGEQVATTGGGCACTRTQVWAREQPARARAGAPALLEGMVVTAAEAGCTRNQADPATLTVAWAGTVAHRGAPAQSSSQVTGGSSRRSRQACAGQQAPARAGEAIVGEQPRKRPLASSSVLSNPRAPPSFESRFTVAAERSRKQPWDLWESCRHCCLCLSLAWLLFFHRSDNKVAVAVAAVREERLLSLEMALGIGGGVRAEGQVEQLRKFSVHRWGGLWGTWGDSGDSEGGKLHKTCTLAQRHFELDCRHQIMCSQLFTEWCQAYSQTCEKCLRGIARCQYSSFSRYHADPPLVDHQPLFTFSFHPMPQSHKTFNSHSGSLPQYQYN